MLAIMHAGALSGMTIDTGAVLAESICAQRQQRLAIDEAGCGHLKVQA